MIFAGLCADLLNSKIHVKELIRYFFRQPKSAKNFECVQFPQHQEETLKYPYWFGFGLLSQFA